MKPPIALQLYTLREALANDFEKVICQVAGIGYVGVETYRFSGISLLDAARILKKYQLKVFSAHTPLPLGENKQEVLDTLFALECKKVVFPYLPPEEFATKGSILKNCDRLNEADTVAQENGLTLFYHNHWWEYREKIDNKSAADFMLKHLNPTIKLEIDTYWAETGGENVVKLLNKLGPRAPLLHIKDGPCDEKQDMVAVGEGDMDFKSILAASQPECLIVEIDRCKTDMMKAVEASYKYLINQGFGYGQKG